MSISERGRAQVGAVEFVSVELTMTGTLVCTPVPSSPRLKGRIDAYDENCQVTPAYGNTLVNCSFRHRDL